MSMLDFIRRVGPSCGDDERRAAIGQHPELNGIDFVEYERRPADPEPHVLVVHFLKSLPDGTNGAPDGAYDLTNRPELVRVEGGRRIVDITVLGVQLVGTNLEIRVSEAGDFSPYWLALGWARASDGRWTHVVPNLDPRLSLARVDFKAGCPSRFDCLDDDECEPEDDEAPALDYLAKDYASFRRLMLDLAAQRNPRWRERNPADVGMAVVELLAYAGDHLSYYQDAVANEAYLGTARRRVSVKRHARLVDYSMHDGRNAWAHVHLRVQASGSVAQHTMLLTRLGDPLPGDSTAPGVVIDRSELPGWEARSSDGGPTAWQTHRGLRHARTFETCRPLQARVEHNEISIHTWGNLECCLPVGTRSAYLYTTDPADSTRAIRPGLVVGDDLLLEEVKGRLTGAAADADSQRRRVVRILKIEDATDRVYSQTLGATGLQVRGSGDPPLPLLYVEWSSEEALPWPLLVSVRTAVGELHQDVSVARGNMVVVDHGRTVVEDPASMVLDERASPRLRLSAGPVTQQGQPSSVLYQTWLGSYLRMSTSRDDVRAPAGDAIAAVVVATASPLGREEWTPVPHLLDSGETDRHFVVDVDHEGRAELRFGDGVYGRRPGDASELYVSYRVGNGTAGNVGAESIAHVVRPLVAPDWPVIERVRNPLAAVDGEEPETIDEVRTAAPEAFATQRRAVTEADYERVALEHPTVAGAVAAFRWTGSWYTVLIGIDPVRDEDLRRLPGGALQLTDGYAAEVRAHVDGYRLAGYDVAVRAGEYVPLDIRIELCVSPRYFRADVIERVHEVLAADRPSGWFHSSRWSFGDPVHLSQLVAVVEAVQGVDSVVVSRFQRQDEAPNGELDAGQIELGPWEIAQLRNDPDFREAGVLAIEARGGK